MTEAAYVELPILGWLCGEPKPEHRPAVSAGPIGTKRRWPRSTVHWRTRLSRNSSWRQLCGSTPRSKLKRRRNWPLPRCARRCRIPTGLRPIDRRSTYYGTAPRWCSIQEKMPRPSNSSPSIRRGRTSTTLRRLTNTAFKASESVARILRCWSMASRSSSPSTRAMSPARRTGARQCISSTDISAKRR